MADSKDVLVIDLDQSEQYQKLLEGRPQSCGMRSGRVYLQPGSSCGQHSTKEHEELLVFLAGTGRLLIQGKDPYTIGVGKVAYIPPQTIHDVENTGEEPLIYIYCVAPVLDQ